MSTGEARTVSRQDIQLVQNLIERCLQLYMSQKEVVNTLVRQAKIEPDFTELVWQKLEEENQEFFRAYYLRLVVKDQILRFNELLERQIELMHQMRPPGVASIPMSNGPQMSSMLQNSAARHPIEHGGPALKPENLQPPHNSGIGNLYRNGASSLQSCLQGGVNLAAHGRRIEMASEMLLGQGRNMGLVQGGVNGGMMKSEADYQEENTHTGFMFGSDNSNNNNNNNNVINSVRTIGDGAVPSFGSVESNSQALNENILDPDPSSFGFLGQIPRNFSLSDLTADFSNSADILESYSRSPFLATDSNDFLDTFHVHGRGEQQDIEKRLDTTQYQKA